MQQVDVIIIGAGIGGILALQEGRTSEMSAVLLEKNHDIGGLWCSLPDWQDIQTRKEDFAINQAPIEGVHRQLS